MHLEAIHDPRDYKWRMNELWKEKKLISLSVNHRKENKIKVKEKKREKQRKTFEKSPMK